jgi:MFS family permease
VSLVGSGLSEFALGLWVYQRSGSITQFGFVFLFKVLPTILLSPLAGVVADRRDRRVTMMLADTGAALTTLVVAVLLLTGQLQVWHIYITTCIASACNTFQTPAYHAAMPQLIGKGQLGRANGLLQLAQAAADILTPALAGLLVTTIRVEGVLLIDGLTFLFAVVVMLAVRFPPLMNSPERPAKHSLIQEFSFGWTYIKARPGLMGLMALFAVVYFLSGMIGVLIMPLVLGFATPDTLGVILSVAGSGLMVGSLVLSAWGGPKNRMAGVVGFGALFGVCLALIGMRPSVITVAIFAFGAHSCLPFINGLNQAIWQSKVPPEVLGRVLAIRQMVTRVAQPAAFVIAGLLADQVFEPLLATNGPLASSVGLLIGVGPGRGSGLLFILMGAVMALVTLGSYGYLPLRRIEQELPDAVGEAI